MKNTALTADKALVKILSRVKKLQTETVPLGKCAGRTLAKNIKAREGMPSFSNAERDGIAVASADLRGASPGHPAVLNISGTIKAGAVKRRSLRNGSAWRIMTGARMPGKADAVIMKELIIRDDGDTVTVGYAPAKGEFVRRKWRDIGPGAPLLRTGTTLRPYEIALLAAQGVTAIPVTRKPRVAIISTGDELRKPCTLILKPGQIRDSISAALTAAVLKTGADPITPGIAPDNPRIIKKMLVRACKESDALIIAGGVSAGDFDHTRSVLNGMGMRTVFWKVAMKPGKPMLFGILPYENKRLPVFGLPGNPLSSFVCFELFAKPALLKMSGETGIRTWLTGYAGNRTELEPGRQHFLFCRSSNRNGRFVLEILPQGSAKLTTSCHADVLAKAPLGEKHISKDGRLPFLWLE